MSVKSRIVSTTKAPALALTPNLFSQEHFDLFNNQLRLYFNQLDALNTALLNANGGANFSLPHISAYDSTNQYAAGNDTPTIVKWSVLSSNQGFTLNNDFTATANVDGVYKIDYSLQFANTKNAQEDVFVWLDVDGIPVTESSSEFTLVARKSALIPSYVVAYSHVTFPVYAGQKIGLWWATSAAYSTTGPVDGIYMEALPAITSPYIRPSNPAAIGTISFVSRL